MKLTAAHLMNPDLLTVHEDMTVHELAVFLVDHEISGAPVVDESGELSELFETNGVETNPA